jgi:hypothetical protein
MSSRIFPASLFNFTLAASDKRATADRSADKLRQKNGRDIRFPQQKYVKSGLNQVPAGKAAYTQLYFKLCIICVSPSSIAD